MVWYVYYLYVSLQVVYAVFTNATVVSESLIKEEWMFVPM